MSGTGHLLELLNDVHQRVSSFEAEVRDWRLAPPDHALVIDRGSDGKLRPRWQGEGPYPTETVSMRRLWAADGGLRVEVTHGGELACLGVRKGSRWWRWDPLHGTASGGLAPGSRPVLPPLLAPVLLEPVRLFPALRFGATSHGERAGREVICVKATPRGGSAFDAAIVRYALEFDAEHGTLLRSAASKNGRWFQVLEAVDVRYGGKIDTERFVFAPPDMRGSRRPQCKPSLESSRNSRTPREPAGEKA